MNINQITIKNFRNIGDECTYNLNPSFTVIIGINGKGKSTILHALRVACGAYFLSIPEVKKRHIKPDEIRLAYIGKELAQNKPVKVEAVGSFPGIDTPITWRRQIMENSNSTTSSEADVGRIRNLGLLNYKRITKEGIEKTDLPVIAYFGTSRAHGAGRNISSRIGRQTFQEGYQDWYEMKSTTFKYENWLTSYDVLKKIRKEYPNTKKAFLDTLKIANPYIQQIEIVNGRIWLKVKMDDYQSELLPLEYHSDGIRFFTELVAETAYRCIILNGHHDLNAVIESRGVIMIDELDLHLHPNWQRHVIKDLRNAFPKLQFIITTHSPFIVQSVKAEELIILDEDISKDGDPFKKSIEEVAAKEMGVDDIPRSVEFLEMQRVAEEYFKLIDEGKTSDDDEQTKSLRNRLNELEERFSDDPAFTATLKVEREAKGL
jgi:predicted ATP-binding protein involved in virulence